MIKKIRFEISEINILIDSYSPLIKLCEIQEPDLIYLSAVATILHSFFLEYNKNDPCKNSSSKRALFLSNLKLTLPNIIHLLIICFIYFFLQLIYYYNHIKLNFLNFDNNEKIHLFLLEQIVLTY